VCPCSAISFPGSCSHPDGGPFSRCSVDGSFRPPICHRSSCPTYACWPHEFLIPSLSVECGAVCKLPDPCLCTFRFCHHRTFKRYRAPIGLYLCPFGKSRSCLSCLLARTSPPLAICHHVNVFLRPVRYSFADNIRRSSSVSSNRVFLRLFSIAIPVAILRKGAAFPSF